jgi:hypothetical protein
LIAEKKINWKKWIFCLNLQRLQLDSNHFPVFTHRNLIVELTEVLIVITQDLNKKAVLILLVGYAYTARSQIASMQVSN